MLYEAHITCDIAQDPEQLATLSASIASKYHWKTSEIARDPVLGDKTYYYLTSHSNSYEILFNRMESAAQALTLIGVPVVRQKIEEIVYDTKVGLNRQGAKSGPRISADEHGCSVMEWWCGDRKITLYNVSHVNESLLKTWGSVDDLHQEFVSLMDAEKVREAFAWLEGEGRLKDYKDQRDGPF